MLKKLMMILIMLFAMGGCGDIEWFPDDTKPTEFAFTPVTDAETNTYQISNVVTIAGNIYPATLKVTNGEYTLDEGKTWAVVSTKISAGQKVQVRHISSVTYLATKTTTLDVSGVKAGFSSTTKAGPVIFSNYTTINPIPSPITFEKVTFEPITAKETSRTSSTVSIELAVTATNADSLEHTVHLTIAGLDEQNRKIVPGYVAVDLVIPAGGTKTGTQTLSLPISLFEKVKTWSFRNIS